MTKTRKDYKQGAIQITVIYDDEPDSDTYVQIKGAEEVVDFDLTVADLNALGQMLAESGAAKYRPIPF
jgi:hypothetical protein